MSEARRHTLVVTGATKGLGRATALAFARAGHRVLGLYAHDEAAAEGLRAELASFGADALVLLHDVSVEDDVLWSRAEIQQADSLVLVNNAWAPFAIQPLHLSTWDDFARALDVGLRGSWLCARALLRPMVRAGRGTIVNVLTSAVHGLPPKGFGPYATAKHALRGLSLALAAEYGANGIPVFSLSPGIMSTALTADWDARLVEALLAKGPVTDPDAAARRILELVDDADAPPGADYVV